MGLCPLGGLHQSQVLGRGDSSSHGTGHLELQSSHLEPVAARGRCGIQELVTRLWIQLHVFGYSAAMGLYLTAIGTARVGDRAAEAAGLLERRAALRAGTWTDRLIVLGLVDFLAADRSIDRPQVSPRPARARTRGGTRARHDTREHRAGGMGHTFRADDSRPPRRQTSMGLLIVENAHSQVSISAATVSTPRRQRHSDRRSQSAAR